MLDLIRNRSASWMTKIIFGIIIIVFIFLGVGNYANKGTHTLGTVNGEAITLVDFQRAVNSTLQNEQNKNLLETLRQNPDTWRAFKYEIFNNLASRTALLQEAREAGLFVSPQELRMFFAQMDIFLDTSGRFDPALYESILRQQNILPSDFETAYINNLLLDKLRNYIAVSVLATEDEAFNHFAFTLENRKADFVLFAAADFADKATPSDAEIEQYFAERQAAFMLPQRGDYDYILLTPESLAANYIPTAEAVAAEYEKNQITYTTPAQLDLGIIDLGPDDKGLDAYAATLASLGERVLAGAGFEDLLQEFASSAAAKEGAALGWIVEQDLPNEIREILDGLAAGQVSKPVALQGRVNVFFLNDRREEMVQPLDAVKETIVAGLTANLVADDSNRLRAIAEDGLRQGTPFETLGEQLGVAPNNTGLIPVDTFAFSMKLSNEAVTSLGYVPAGRAAPAPLDVADGMLLVFVREIRPAEVPPLEEVREDIQGSLIAQKSKILAREAAEALLPEMAKTGALPAAYADKVQQTNGFVRVNPVVEPLGSVPQLVNTLFQSDMGQWLPAVYEVNNGTVIARLAEITPAPVEQWEQMKPFLLNAILQNKREMVIAAYFDNVGNRAKVEAFENILDMIPLQ